ncbi:hypothetical protein ACIO6U_03705 [Streptomyces sp. NPDC087422]|uniref:hypothetical protein n=1 Tax=Streptomyces sp. NPDC087422 TaxID=3365786 RepID=UPI003826CB93
MPAPGEPLWTDEDRAWALALAQVEADVCPDCGHPWSETTAAAAEERYTAEVVRCHACTAGAQRVAAHQKNNGNTTAMHVLIQKRT